MRTLFIILFLFVALILYKPIYVLVDELFLEVVDCNLNKDEHFDVVQANAGCVILDEQGKILLVRDHYSKQYSIPGGSARSGEISACCAHRETFEESGINVKIIKKLFVANNGFHVFLCQAPAHIDMSYIKKYEIDELVFKDINEIQHYKYPQQLEEIKINLLGLDP